MLEQELSLEELSDRTGVEARTLRSWVSEGLLSPPFKPGRGARYPAANIDRALAVRALKEGHGLSFADIGRRLMMASDEQIRDWASEAGVTVRSGNSAREYLSDLQAKSGLLPGARSSASQSRANLPPPAASGAPRASDGKALALYAGRVRQKDRDAELASIERLILQLQAVLGSPAPRRSRGSIWTRIPVTPDLEISIRGDLERHERILFEQLADQFRAILTGGSRHD
jgi:DNA-binding transcriptional MerR regulator